MEQNRAHAHPWQPVVSGCSLRRSMGYHSFRTGTKGSRASRGLRQQYAPEIGLELHMQAANVRGEFPASLSTLRAYANDPNLHLCPSFKSAVPLPLHRHELDRYGSYYYVAGLTDSNSRDRNGSFIRCT